MRPPRQTPRQIAELAELVDEAMGGTWMEACGEGDALVALGDVLAGKGLRLTHADRARVLAETRDRMASR